MSIARVQWPERIAAGEVVKVRLLIQHPMDTGYLQDLTGRLVPRNVIRLLTCTLGGQ
jgi:sulfur-oxidizing protein SoxZ